ncbi:efflux RND transporter periplasmic adaptor subunit [Porticoccus sp.]
MPKAVIKNWIIPLSILLVAIIVVTLLAAAKPVPQPQMPGTEQAPKIPVQVADPQSRQIMVYAQGTVQPKTEITLTAEVSGQVVTVSENFVDGGFFEQGEPLLQLDDRDYRIAVTQARSRVAEAEKTLAMESGQARQAKREWRDLGNTEGNALFLREPQLKAAKAALAAAEADLQQALINLERTSIRAPFAGRVRQTEVDLGQYVSAGTQVAAIFDIGTAEIRLPLTADQTALLQLPLQPNQQVRLPVTLSAWVGGEQATWQGWLLRTEASIDTRSRVLYGIVEVSEPLAHQPPMVTGLFVQAEIAGKTFQNVLSVPRSALYEKNRLLVLDDQQQLQIVTVQVLQFSGEQALVTGIEQGKKVLLERPGYVIEGMSIEPVISSDVASDQ